MSRVLQRHHSHLTRFQISLAMADERPRNQKTSDLCRALDQGVARMFAAQILTGWPLAEILKFAQGVI